MAHRKSYYGLDRKVFLNRFPLLFAALSAEPVRKKGFRGAFAFLSTATWVQHVRVFTLLEGRKYYSRSAAVKAGMEDGNRRRGVTPTSTKPEPIQDAARLSFFNDQMLEEVELFAAPYFPQFAATGHTTETAFARLHWA